MNLKQIEDQALHLSEDERAELAQKLLLSLDSLSEDEIEEDWLREAQRRAKELDEGIVSTYTRGGSTEEGKDSPKVSYYFHPAAEAEHLESVAYFESKRPGLGATYLAEFEKILADVCEFPGRYPIERKPDIRR